MAEPTYGGRLLKQYREERNLKQLQLQLENVIPQTVLSKIENGKTERPLRETVERLLKRYGTTFDESQEALKAFGYFPEHPLPDAEAVAVVIAQLQPVLDTAPVPTYIVDFIMRLHGWDKLWHKLSGLEADELAMLKGQPLWKVEYDNWNLADDGLDDTLLEDVQKLRQQMRVYIGEPWFETFLEECGEPFLSHWQAVGNTGNMPQDETLPGATSMLRQIQFEDAPDVDFLLDFFITEEVIDFDRRFRIIRYMPADGPTWEWVKAAQERLF